MHLAVAVLFLKRYTRGHRVFMRWLLYLRLITLTAGTLLPFIWMVVILGHRRQRNFERIFFFLCLALTCTFGSNLLALNAQLFYATIPASLISFAWTFLCLGLWFIPSLLVHLHVEYGSVRELSLSGPKKLLWLLIAWVPALVLCPYLLLALHEQGRFETPMDSLGLPFQLWLVAAVISGAYWEWQFAKEAPDEQQRSFHGGLRWDLINLSFWIVVLIFGERFVIKEATLAGVSLVAMISAITPLGMLIGKVQQFNFLGIGRQRNLIYAVFGIFVALLYLSFVRRASMWMEFYLPPEATAALLLFLPVVFFEPLQRVIRRMLRQTAQTEVDRAQKLMGPINEAARLGDLENLRLFAERWIGDQLQLAEVHLLLDSSGPGPQFGGMSRGGSEESFEIHRGGQRIGTLAVRSHVAMVSGETFAALEFVCEQLPAAFDLCRLIEEKLGLERELAERERLALVGQMAASISHNLKNPLGSIKTILQVQMENSEMPASLRQETQMVLDEVRRLSEKLNQLLQFSRPGVRSNGAGDRCDVSRVAGDVVGVFCHEADRRGIALHLKMGEQPVNVVASPEAANDILSNLLLNALEAASTEGHVCLSLDASNGLCRVDVEDDGAGVPPALKEKILQPFFTTKARGTGLGLAIVARRVEEVGGKLEVKSPIQNDRGSRFSVTLPLAAKETQP